MNYRRVHTKLMGKYFGQGNAKADKLMSALATKNRQKMFKQGQLTTS